VKCSRAALEPEIIMLPATYFYSFRPEIPMAEVEDSLTLATMAAESLHGRSRVRLEARFVLEADRRACRIEAATPVGQDLASIFTGLLARQFGEEGFSVEAR